MIQRHQRERAESPKHERMGDARKRPLANHLRLQQDFPDEIPHPFSQRTQPEIGVGLRLADLAKNLAEAQRKSARRTRQQHQKQDDFGRRKEQHLLKL